MTRLRSTAALQTATVCVLAAAAVGGQERDRMPTYDDLLVRVEERVPGFGGMFVDSEGGLVVYLRDPGQLPAARSAIEAVFGSGRVPSTGLRAARGRYSVSQLKAWTERAGPILTLPGVTMLDLDEAKNRVGIGVADTSRIRAVQQELSSLGIPREAVVIQVTESIRALPR